MGGRIRPPESFKMADPALEKKKGFGDWMNFMKPANEEKDHWVITAFVVALDVKLLCSWYILWTALYYRNYVLLLFLL